MSAVVWLCHSCICLAPILIKSASHSSGWGQVYFCRSVGVHPVSQAVGLPLQGLRTLVLASRILGNEEWARWNKGYQEAAASLEGREARIAAEARKVETDLQLVGVTAIEDKLQDGVPEAIQTLVTAGIKVCARAASPTESDPSPEEISLFTCLAVYSPHQGG